VRYARASGDLNALHNDEQMAQVAGIPTVFSMGMFQAGLLASYATDWIEPYAVRRFAVRFREQVWPDDVLICAGEVVAVEDASDGVRVEVTLTCSRRGSGVAIIGSAEFLLP
jgi:acyl dehydratase